MKIEFETGTKELKLTSENAPDAFRLGWLASKVRQGGERPEAVFTPSGVTLLVPATDVIMLAVSDLNRLPR